MRIFGSLLLLGSVGLLSSCQEVLLPEEPGEGPVTNFEFAWAEVDRHYSFFDLKGIDWEEMRAFYSQWIDATSTPADLFSILSEMLGRLEDGHVGLFSPFATYRYSGWYAAHSHNFHFDLIWRTLLQGRGNTPSGKIFFGWITPDIGYIHLPTFTGSNWASEIDEVLQTLEQASALVLDVRDNSGGNDGNAERIAGRFTRDRRLYRRIQYRNGPAHSDFTAPLDDYLEPNGKRRFLGPVAVLTNRRTFSAAESFVLAMRTLPQVRLVGDTTGGGSGNPLFREMPNGWSLSVSRWIEWAPDGTTHEGIGIGPHHHTIIPAHLIGLSDPILLKAVEILNNR